MNKARAAYQRKWRKNNRKRIRGYQSQINRHRWGFFFGFRSSDYNSTLQEIATVMNDQLETEAVRDLSEKWGHVYSEADIRKTVHELREQGALGFYRKQSVDEVIRIALRKIEELPGSLRKLREIIYLRKELRKMRDARELQNTIGSKPNLGTTKD